MTMLVYCLMTSFDGSMPFSILCRSLLISLGWLKRLMFPLFLQIIWYPILMMALLDWLFSFLLYLSITILSLYSNICIFPYNWSLMKNLNDMISYTNDGFVRLNVQFYAIPFALHSCHYTPRTFASSHITDPWWKIWSLVPLWSHMGICIYIWMVSIF